jgi:hypothetical protein
MVLSLKTSMRFLCLYLLVSVAASVAALADPVPIDPQILIDSGGDAFNLDYNGHPITIANGGGIFAFHNNTGGPLSEIDINLLFQVPQLNIAVKGTFASTTTSGQSYSFEPIPLWKTDCAGNPSMTESCLELQFSATPGPLIPTDGNFVLDLNDRASYNSDDLAVLNGTYDSSKDGQGGGGSWPSVSGNVDPIPFIPAVPEPSYRATAGFMGLALLAAWNLRRRLSTAKKS